MQDKQSHQAHGYIFHLLLCVLGGCLTVVSYICCGGVFANVQTANVTLLMLAFFEGQVFSAAQHLFSLCAFAAGAVVAESIRRIGPRIKQQHGSLLLLLNAGNALVFSFVDALTVRVVLISILAAFQFVGFRHWRSFSYASIMLTGNIASMMQNLVQGFGKSASRMWWESAVFFGFIVAFCFGMGAGVCLLRQMDVRLVMCAVAGVYFFMAVSLLKRDRLYLKNDAS